MREIKFRQPLIGIGTKIQWHYWGFIRKGEFTGPLNDLKKPSYQYTRSKDKNGKEIYEGDILYLRDSTYSDDYEVRWTEGHWEIHSEVDVNTELLERWINYCEIIGNIYENKNLLD